MNSQQALRAAKQTSNPAHRDKTNPDSKTMNLSNDTFSCEGSLLESLDVKPGTGRKSGFVYLLYFKL